MKGYMRIWAACCYYASTLHMISNVMQTPTACKVKFVKFVRDPDAYWLPEWQLKKEFDDTYKTSWWKSTMPRLRQDVFPKPAGVRHSMYIVTMHG